MSLNKQPAVLISPCQYKRLRLNTTLDGRHVTEAVLFSLHYRTQHLSSIFLHLQGRNFTFTAPKMHASQIPFLPSWMYPEERPTVITD